ncbi:hypothetical protein [Xylella fastidiosa]|uniref:Uncharacterized protein n=1 Tax=Xylella fastidiosa (strain 9a5c) TaxID=160492 RepID=Q9PC08_XYLFA|nr:hypothetical protein [Xylella fastidiosa]AAF84779.1 hypothetical protein XF_1977 [Xylella fastidiosa 9a5c]MDG5824151.1 hypothetical protein [Xylella fastidiosa subsp. pauca]MDG5824571.1 hypothetical protein [Xylella fastidiosa subsp. pauca]WGZ32881.1 hypothetical protein O4444_04575 [Xylella fastidiosa subsp. pauca]WGZ33316.1 hypothetical protein O4445_06395 [Xylella fastidiosa subsp. pauca]
MGLYLIRPWERLAHERALPSSTALSSGELWTLSDVLSHCPQRNSHVTLSKRNGIHKVPDPSYDLYHNAILIELKFCLVTNVLLWLTLRQHAILFPRHHKFSGTVSMKIECIGLKCAQPFYNANLKKASALLVRFQSQQLRETRVFSFSGFLTPSMRFESKFLEKPV